jgi:3-oxoacyl-[acyl-carrier protein] reductase
MDLGLRGKAALVAASSRGLGYAIARELAAEGAAVAICARGESRLKEAAREIGETTGARVVPVVGDVARPEDVARILGRALAELGRVDVLVTNSGGPPSGTFESTPPAAWKAAVDVLLTSAVELIRGVLPGMKERRFGRILNVTSIAVKQPVENLILSNSLRAAVTGMARTLANEVAPFGITVNNLVPGYTRTERLVELSDTNTARTGAAASEFYSKLEREIPARRLGEPAELAALAAFLASERASYVTGQSIVVDGGWVRGLF